MAREDDPPFPDSSEPVRDDRFDGDGGGPQPAEEVVAPERRRPVAAFGRFLGITFLVVLASSVLALASLVVYFLLAAALEHLPGTSSGVSYWVQVWSFEEMEPGAGDPEGLAAAVAAAGLSARWYLAGEGRSGRTALDCGDPCSHEPLDDYQAFASIFRDHGYSVDQEDASGALRPDYRAGIWGPWASNVLFFWWCVTMPFVALGLISVDLRRNLAHEHGTTSSRLPAAGAASLGLVLGAGLAVVATPYHLVFGKVGPPPRCPNMDLGSVATSGTLGFSLAVLAAVIALPLAQELFFRGWAFPYLERNVGRVTAYWGSAGLWAALCFSSGRFPQAFLVGLVLAWAYRRWGSLLVPITAHAAINGAALVILKLRTPPF